MSLLSRRNYGLPCVVEGCGCPVAIKKAKLCITHYNRNRETGSTGLLAIQRACRECGSGMVLSGAARIRQIYCSESCRGQAKRRNELSTESGRTHQQNIRYKWKLHRYGMTVGQYEQMRLSQHGCCAICKRHETETQSRLTVDHDHINGRIRGLLCRQCNAGLGSLQDNADLLRAAIDYLSGAEPPK